MKNMKVFEGKKVEVFEFKGKILFNPNHVGECLGLKNVRESLRGFNDTQTLKLKNSDVENLDIRKLNNAGERFVTESGLYKLIFKSKKPQAEKFQNWVVDEVLPEIRKNGRYEQKALGPMELLELQFAALKEQKEKIAEHDERLSKIEDLSEVTTGQSVTIKKLVDKKVYEALKDAYHDKEIRNRTYKTIWKDYKAFFNITSYHCTLKKDFEKALEIVTNWTPQGELARDIDLSRRQMVC